MLGNLPLVGAIAGAVIDFQNLSMMSCDDSAALRTLLDMVARMRNYGIARSTKQIRTDNVLRSTDEVEIRRKHRDA